MEEKLFLENINDRINDLQSLKLRKNSATFLRIQLSKLERGVCPGDNTLSLSNALGLNQPIESDRLREPLDIMVYNFLFQQISRDVNNFNNILFSDNNFGNRLKVAL